MRALALPDEGQVLAPGHLGGDGGEIVQPAGAALPFAADTVPVDSPGVVSNPYLPELDPGSICRRQVLYQLAKIYPLFSGEEEGYLAAVELIFHVHQSHFQLMLIYELKALVEGLFFFLTVEQHAAPVGIATTQTPQANISVLRRRTGRKRSEHE